MARGLRKRNRATPAEALCGDSADALRRNACGSTLARRLRKHSGETPAEAL